MEGCPLLGDVPDSEDKPGQNSISRYSSQAKWPFSPVASSCSAFLRCSVLADRGQQGKFPLLGGSGEKAFSRSPDTKHPATIARFRKPESRLVWYDV